MEHSRRGNHRGDRRADLLRRIRREIAAFAVALAGILVGAPAVAQQLVVVSPHVQTGGGNGFGESLDGFNDLNGDGRGDFLVGARGETSFEHPGGAAYLLSGDGSILREFHSPLGDRARDFGFDVSGARDMNGDGVRDLLISEPDTLETSFGDYRFGAVHVFSGADGELISTVRPIDSGAVFGLVVRGLPDVTGDGSPDVAVGSSSGLFLFSETDFRPVSISNAAMPLSIAQIGNVGGSSLPDLAFGTQERVEPLDQVGRVRVLSGDGTVLHAIDSPTPTAGGRFGASVAGIPDLDADGVPDLLVGAPGEETFYEISGRAYVFSGATGARVRTLVAPDEPHTFQFGRQVASAGDANDDGLPDILVSCIRRSETDFAVYAGAVHLFSGATGELLSTIEAPSRSSTFGSELAALPDRSGDGLPEFLVGDPYELVASGDPAGVVSVHGAVGPRLGNISTRGNVGTGDSVMIAGLIVTGSTPQRTLVSGIGPDLANFGVANPLADPVLLLFRGGAMVAENDNWIEASNMMEISDTGRAPNDPLEAAILTDLAPGEYTAILHGAGEAPTGAGLVQVFDESEPALRPGGNLSTRGFVGVAGSELIGGLIVAGAEPVRVLVRALGPTLEEFGVSGVLADPVLFLADSSQAVLATNDDWRDGPDAEDIDALGFAPGETESVLVATLPPGNYTAIVSGADGATGNALVEIYKLP